MTCPEQPHVRVIDRNLQDTHDYDISGQHLGMTNRNIQHCVWPPCACLHTLEHLGMLPTGRQTVSSWTWIRASERSPHAAGNSRRNQDEAHLPAYGLLLGHWYPTDVWVPVPSRWSLRPSTGIPPITDHHPGGRSREQQSLCSVPTPLMSHLMKRGGCWGSCSMVQHQAVNSGPTWGCVFLMPPCFRQSGQNLAHRRAAGGHFVERWQSSFCSCLYKGSV